MHLFYAGRALYALIELVDVTCYATAYRGVFIVIINRLRSALATEGAELPSSLALFPTVLAAVDYLEDSLQVARLSLKHQCSLPSLMLQREQLSEAPLSMHKAFSVHSHLLSIEKGIVHHRYSMPVTE
jgi:hypothetical protein